MLNIGTQTFGLAKEFTEDFFGTIEKLHGIGFTSIEPLVLFQEEQKKSTNNLWSYELLKKAKPVLESYGMTIPSVHVGVGIGIFTMPANTIIKNLIYLHEEMDIHTFVFSGMLHTKMEAKKWGKLLNKVSNAMRPYGCTIAYHNHEVEFDLIKVKGERLSVMDYLLEVAGPDVKLQLDIGWAALKGDECVVAKKYADRIVELHYKDFYKEGVSGKYNHNNMPEDQFAPIGEGIVQSEALFNLCHEFPNFNGAFIIDQDKYTGNMLDALCIGHQNISSYQVEKSK